MRRKTAVPKVGKGGKQSAKQTAIKDPKKVAAGKKGGAASAVKRAGEKTPGSGRAAGTPNRRTVEVMETLQAAGFNPDAPFLLWAELLTEGMKPQGDENKTYLVGHDNEGGAIYGRPPLTLMHQAAKELASYIAPKRRAIELAGADGGPIKVLMINLDELEASGVGVIAADQE